MTSLTRTDHLALAQLTAHTTLPVLSRVAVRVAWLCLLWHRRSRSRAVLRDLDTRMPRDIGLTPKQAHVESRKWFWRP